MPINPQHLPEWMQPMANAIEVRPIRSRHFAINATSSAVELVLDLASPELPGTLARPLRRRYGAGTLHIVEDGLRGQHMNIGAVITKLEVILLLVGDHDPGV
jgi:hypothetical protein